MKKNNLKFTLIELVLALGMVLGALVGLMSLFVVGTSNVTEARETFYADLAVKNILNYAYFNLQHYSDGKGFFDTHNSTGLYQMGGSHESGAAPYNLNLKYLPEQLPDEADLGDIRVVDIAPSSDWRDMHDGATFFPPNSVYVYKKAGATDDELKNNGYTYLVNFNHTVHDAEGNHINPDFRGIVTLWKENTNVIDGINDREEITPNSKKSPYAVAVRICAEISWPAEAEYGDRLKKKISVEVPNTNYGRN